VLPATKKVNEANVYNATFTTRNDQINSRVSIHLAAQLREQQVDENLECCADADRHIASDQRLLGRHPPCD
jgi:hypothetical protein